MEEEKMPKTTRATFERNSKYNKPEVEERIIKLREDGETWDEITLVMREELGEPKLSRPQTQNIFNRAIAKTRTIERRGGKKMKDFSKELGNIQAEAITVLDGYINAAKQVSKELTDMIADGNIEAVKAYGIILKTAPQMKAITSEIRDFIKLHYDQQDKIKEEEQALVWNESQMLDYMDKYLAQLEKEGKIRFIKPKL